MPERRRTRSAVKVQRSTTQTTLKDLFQRTNSGTAPVEKEQNVLSENADPPLQAVSAHPPAKPHESPLMKPFPIFTKVVSMKQRPREAAINVDEAEVIDITDTSSGTEPPLSSTHHPSPRFEVDQEASRSPPPSPTRHDSHRCGDASLSHERTRPHKARKKEVNKRAQGLGDDAPFPSSSSQHVRGVQHFYTCSQAPLKYRAFPNRGLPDEGTLDFLTERPPLDDAPSISSDRVQEDLTPQQCEEYYKSLSGGYVESHPAFAQISVHRQKAPLHDGDMWTRRFRPRRAEEVLGNEQHALYLRDWLRALELRTQGRGREETTSKGGRDNVRVAARGVKRPRVVRAVTRKRGSKRRRVDSDDDLDDFVVYSDAEEEPADEPFEDSEDEFEFCQRTLTRLQRCQPNEREGDIDHATSQSQASVRSDFADKLTNTLLITGPPGCGKTAAVYACAEELGWDVFEVYPGIGKRNGASLEQLVGDVGKNHIVQGVQRGVRGKASLEGRGLREYLGKSKRGEFAGFGRSEEAGTEGRPISVEDESPKQEVEPLPPGETSEEAVISDGCHEASDGSGPKVGQSVVLLEEVDVLFKEDAGFWPAVVEFIGSCQRPVVLTCNDPGLVPVGDLPLQRELVFEPCPSTVAATFLQCVSLAEGWLVPHEDLMVLYERREAKNGIDVPDGGMCRGTERVGLPDLRRSITQLQMLCAGERRGSASEMHQGEEAKGHVRGSGGAISVASRGARTDIEEGEWWRRMGRQSELMSHVDAGRCRRAKEVSFRRLVTVVEMLTAAMEVGVEEDEVGYVVLGERGGEEDVWERDELIAAEAIRYSRGVHAECGTGPIEASINPATGRECARVGAGTRTVEALQAVVGRRAVVGGVGVHLEYIPWVRHMVGVEDGQRMCFKGGRCTRNSMRTEHAPSVVDGDWQREEMRRRRFE